MPVINEYLTVLSPSFGEYTEKRSRFVSGIYPCDSIENAFLILQRVKSDNFGANHNVYAFVGADGSARFSDDGEPHGTAGKPVLEVVQGSGLKNVLAVVTRYFGGVLLGTGGLVRAYSTAAKNAVAAAKTFKMCECVIFEIACAYSDHEKLLSVISKNGGLVENTLFAEGVTVTFNLLLEKKEQFQKNLNEAFSGRLAAEVKKIGIFPVNI